MSTAEVILKLFGLIALLGAIILPVMFWLERKL